MQTTITIRNRLVPSREIAFVEGYVPRETAALQTARAFQSRVVFLNRDSMLIEEAVAAFAETNGFRIFADDDAALNPALR